MAAYAFAVPVLPGQEETNQRFVAAIEGPRWAEYEATWRQLGVSVERIWHQATPQGTLAIVYLELEDLGRLFGGLATSDDPYVVWFRQQILAIHGLDLSQPPAGPPNALIRDWSDA
jgi:hypothetical protein